MIALFFSAFAFAASAINQNLFAGHNRYKFIYSIYSDYAHFHYGYDFANGIALKYIKGEPLPQNSYYVTDISVYPPFQAAFQTVLITPENTTVPVYCIERNEDFVYVYGFPPDPRNDEIPLLVRLKASFLVKNTQNECFVGDP